MPDLKSDLRAYFDALAQAAESDARPETVRRRNLRPVVLAAAAVLAVGLIVAGMALRDAPRSGGKPLTTSDQDDDERRVSPSTTVGPDYGVILDLVGLTVGEARSLATDGGFQFAVAEGDPPFDAAVVFAVEPPHSQEPPLVIGVRTVLPDPPASAECSNTRHPRDAGSGDGLPNASQVTRQAAELELNGMRGSRRFPGTLYVGEWNRFANMIDGQSSIERHDAFQIISVLGDAADCPSTITFSGGLPITFVTVSPDGWTQ